MKSFIQITRHLDGEPHYMNLVIIASNGSAMGSQEIYLNTKSVKEMGENLVKFPKHERSNYLFERGSERPEDKFGWYFRLRLAATGGLRNTSVMQLRFNNNEAPNQFTIPLNPQLTDFCMNLEVGDVHRLGQLLINFSKLEHDRLYWNPETGYLDNVVGQLPRNDGHVEHVAFQVLPQ